MFSRCFLDYFVGVGAFVKGLSQISVLFSNKKIMIIPMKKQFENVF